jgi:cytochrome b
MHTYASDYEFNLYVTNKTISVLQSVCSLILVLLRVFVKLRIATTVVTTKRHANVIEAARVNYLQK